MKPISFIKKMHANNNKNTNTNTTIYNNYNNYSSNNNNNDNNYYYYYYNAPSSYRCCTTQNTEYLVKTTYCDKTPSPVCDFKPSGDQHSEAFHRSGVQETKGDCAPLDRSLVTLMAQESLIETIGAKRTLEIANIRRQLSC